ncbi:MAG TPA: DMT family transporter [Alphaproteobacteria bacterium]
MLALGFCAHVARGEVGAVTWMSLGYLAICSSILAYAAWYWSLVKGGIARIAVARFCNPLVTVALAVAILNERVTWPLALSGATILAGVWLVQSRRG